MGVFKNFDPGGVVQKKNTGFGGPKKGVTTGWALSRSFYIANMFNKMRGTKYVNLMYIKKDAFFAKKCLLGQSIAKKN